MRPIDRPRTVSPDVSRFISPAEPDDLVEVDDFDETQYVQHVPVKPPPPARFANRRKLYEDNPTDGNAADGNVTEEEPAFGDGIIADASSERDQADARPPEVMKEVTSREPTGQSENAARDKGRSRRGRRGRGGETSAARGSGNNSAPEKNSPSETRRPHTGGRPDAGSTGPTKAADKTKPVSDSLDRSSLNEKSGESSGTNSGTSEQGEGRKRSRRRGRRRGPRPEGGDA